MPLLRPNLNNITAFDAQTGSNVFFTVPQGGDQVTANRLTIINQTTGLQVYQETQTRFPLYHSIPPEVLSNGQYYSAYINTFNSSNVMSANSNTVQFYCFTLPSFVLSNIPLDSVITNNTFNFEVTYHQAEGELLDRYRYDLYDAQQIFVSTSGVQFVGHATPPPTLLSYEFGGFADNTAYFIKVYGVTVNGTEIETPLTSFTVAYVQPNVFAIVELSQNCTGGYVTVKSNMTDIDGTSSPTPPIYINDESVDLRAEGSWVNWDGEQFDFSGDWSLNIWGKDFTPNKTIVRLINNIGGSIIVRVLQGELNSSVGVKTYVDCGISSVNGLNYYIYSNPIDVPLSADTIQICLKRINNVYQINIYNLS